MDDGLGPGLPGTVVGLSATRSFHGPTLPRSAQIDPRTAQVLAAVLLAAAEQVSSEKLKLLGATTGADLSLLGLAMAFRDDDTGLMGDVFEWSLLSAINFGDSEITQLATDALTLAGCPVSTPKAVLVAAESGRLVEFSPLVPFGAKIMSGRRGRPWLVENALAVADTRIWKADVLLGSEDRWVTASVKSNPKHVLKSCRDAVDGPYPVRIGITPDDPSKAGVLRDPVSNAIIIRVPVDLTLMALTRGVIRDVQAAFARHLGVPETPLARDASGIGEQLHRWRKATVRQAVATLHDVAAGAYSISVSELTETSSDATGLTDALVALNPLTESLLARGERGVSSFGMRTAVTRSLREFPLLD